MANQAWRKAVWVFLWSCAACFAQTFTPLLSFDSNNGEEPGGMRLVQGLDGNYYGTTEGAGGIKGGSGYGTIFRLTPDGALTTLQRFKAKDPAGSNPFGGLVQDLNGDFYGTDCAGGNIAATSTCALSGGYGTIFKITASGAYSMLHVFEGTDGAAPQGALVRGADGNFYGTTTAGGAYNPDGQELHYGTVFQVTPEGVFTTLYSFSGPDGCYPGGLVLGPDGDLYGTTGCGGTSYIMPDDPGVGTVYKISPSGTLTTLHNFSSQSGGQYCTNCQTGGLTLRADGGFYGTTPNGGAYGEGEVYRISAEGVLTDLHNFDNTDGAHPIGGLVSANDGNLYGTTRLGGASNYGTIFRITAGGVFTSLFSFSSPDRQGSQPAGTMLEGTDGNFYGTTSEGGAANVGVLFQFSTGLAPFVKTLPHLAKVGAAVEILGTGLTGAISVSFNGTPARFTVVSPSQISAIVPSGATTGYVRVGTPGGMLASDGPFYVK
ncbi:MAG: choice-of-anchor tandem repeat GloVer-containing protein [Bryobacteraceae bacterium]|jgi:uncharacterized repeat protein (TIGR03803 family)